MAQPAKVNDRIELGTVRIDRHGRLVIPSRLRRAMGLKPGDRLVASVEGGRLVLKELWREMAKVEGDLATELIQERRQEAQREDG